VNFRINITTLVFLAFTVSLSAQTGGTDYKRIGTSMQKFGDVFKEVTSTYVDDIDPLPLVEAGIEGMMKYLDPYSTYMRTDDTDDIDVLTNGQYVGFGFTVGMRDSQLTIIDLREGYPAQKSGIRIGDVLAYINSNRVDTVYPSNLKPYSKGPVNTTAVLKLVRLGLADTVVVTLQRANIPVENVSYYHLMKNGTAYLKLSRFSRSAGRDVRESLDNLQAMGKVTSFVIDLRDNPGGLLDAAVSIAENFLPKGTLVVSTVSRNGRRSDYRTTSEPLYPNLPLSIIINSHSASASEILAGAFQDLDRAIIVGENSFGKGLVQTIHPLPDAGTLKLTSARYFTPSGRNVQKVDYLVQRQRADLPTAALPQFDKNEFRTANGRLVLDHNGVTPDVIVQDSLYAGVVRHVISSGAIFKFATKYSAVLNELPFDFSISKKTLDLFFKYVETEMQSIKFPELNNLATARIQATKDGLNGVTIKFIEQAEKSAESDVWKTLRQNSSTINQLLEIEIRVRFGTEKDRISRLLQIDVPLQKATDMMVPVTYNAILTGHSRPDQ